ncbi:MAG: YqgE/AlgH family protein [Acidobacteria bacterium]|nr:YqgE/AlgH family protein [Acidobacteriota bacterium]
MPGGAAPLLLISMPQMADPNFARAVVLLCDYTAQGAFGLVVNRQIDDPAWQLIKTTPEIRVDPDVRLWMGGPVDLQRAWVLMSEAQGPEDEQREVAPGVLLSVSHELTLRLLQAPPSSRARVIVGYAGWTAGQLEKELAASAWLTAEVDPGLIFGVPPEEMWETALRRLGADPAALQTSSGVH